MIGYKGFDKNFKCRDFQFEAGKTYKHDGEIKICDSGFHFCENPLAVFNFYSPVNSRFALVEATSKIISGSDKSCTDELTIVKELSLDELVAAVPKEATATNTGYQSAATNTGNWSAACVSGDESVAVVIGKDSKAKGALGCWLTLAEWHDDHIIDVQAFKVDGERIQADTFYTLKDGKPTKVDD